MYCWGQNGSGQIARGAIDSLDTPVPVPDLVVGTTIAAGAAFSCAASHDGAVFCWGDDSYGQLGIGSGAIRPAPTAVPGVGGAISIAAGDGHTCVATTGMVGDVLHHDTLCWGADQAGQLGDGITTDRARPGPLTVDIGAMVVAAGDAHTCAVTSEPGLWCWGRGNAGQLGLGPNRLIDVHTPIEIEPTNAPPAVAVGAAHTCAIIAGGIQCFGANAHGQLGDGTTTDRSTPPAAGVVGPVTPVAAVAAGGAHTCARDADGQVWCWGQRDEGEVGDGIGVDRLSPVPIAIGGGAKATAIAAGAAHTCALADGGDLYCWGRGTEGQLGGSDTANAATPTRIAGITGALDVAAGRAHTCAVAADNTVLCWGANDAGQLGNGTTAASPTTAPTPVTGLAGVASITAGGAHTCARLVDGTVSCWGADTSGQLGDGVALSASVPALARIACD
jgi:hypothetical protein